MRKSETAGGAEELDHGGRELYRGGDIPSFLGNGVGCRDEFTFARPATTLNVAKALASPSREDVFVWLGEIVSEESRMK